MTGRCRLKPEELIAYQDGTLPVGRGEIVEAHLIACPCCQERIAAFREVDNIIRQLAIPSAEFEQGRAGLRDRLRREDSQRQRSSAWLMRAVPLRRPVFVRPLVALLVALAPVPVTTRADFPLDTFVRSAEVEIKERLSPDEQRPVQHVAPSDPAVSRASFQPVAPAALPLGLVRVEQSTPSADRVEVLYRSEAGIAILVSESPVGTGAVTLDSLGIDLASVRDTDVVITRDTRPDAVAALVWERGDVIFNVLVIEAPTGGTGGFKQADALQVVEALIEAQDTGQE